MSAIHWTPVFRLISEHPIASVFTVAVCLVVFVLGALFCLGVLRHK
ncbi:hypothetical protein [Segatella oulorum]|nr:hypothetical protein [Segatella oulorum]